MKISQPSLFHQSNRTNPFGFLIIITPSAGVRNYANDLKLDFYQRYGPYESRYSKPHITISHFPLLEERQDKIFSLLQNGLTEIDPFLLELNGFGRFPNSHVLYLNVNQSEELKALHAFFLRSKAQLRLGKKCIVIKNHHITIAKNLRSKVFESVCDRYLSRAYYNSFLVDKLHVLRYDPFKRQYSKLLNLKLGR